MLDFTNMRYITNQMLEESRAYTEKFWQSVFALPKFNSEYSTYDSYEFYGDDNYDLEDSQEVFVNLYFKLVYTCYGEILVEFDINTDMNDLGFKLSAECLLTNHFIQKGDFEFVLASVHNIDKI